MICKFLWQVHTNIHGHPRYERRQRRENARDSDDEATVLVPWVLIPEDGEEKITDNALQGRKRMC